MDLLVGTENGYIPLYAGSDSEDSVPLLSSEGYLASMGTSIQHYQSSPCLYDYDKDGIQDLLVGAGNGKIYVYINTGTAQNYSYSNSYFMLEIETGVVDLGGNAVLQTVDLNGDSILDLIVGYYTSSYVNRTAYFQGTSSGSTYNFEPPVDLYSDWGESILTYGTDKIYPFAGDINSDNSLEMFAGEYYGEVFFFPGVPGNGISESSGSIPAVPQLTLFSNPVKQSILQLQVTVDGPSTLTILDCSGRQVTKRTVNTGNINIDMQNLPLGVYTVVLNTSNGNVAQRVTVIEQ